MRYTQRGVSGRHPYLTMSGYPLNVPVLKYWYLVPLTKVLWAAALYLQFSNSKPLYIASFYRRPSASSVSLEEPNNSIPPNLCPNITIWGDFNAPDINWDTWQTTNSSTASSHHKLLSLLFENSLSQMVRQITRPISSNILDLIVTSNPVLVNNVEVLPGILDHNIVLFDINTRPKFQNKPPRKVYTYKKSDPLLLRSKVSSFCSRLSSL